MIVSVYGTCDNYDVIFTERGGVWRCHIPPDWADGQYVCEFYAETDAGVQGYWTGVLYINGEWACPELKEDLFKVWLLPKRTEMLTEGMFTVLLLPERARMLLDRSNTTMLRRARDGSDTAQT